MPERIRSIKNRQNVNKPAWLNRIQKPPFSPSIQNDIVEDNVINEWRYSLMSGLRHRDAPVMPLGLSVFALDLQHFVGDLDQ